MTRRRFSAARSRVSRGIVGVGGLVVEASAIFVASFVPNCRGKGEKKDISQARSLLRVLYLIAEGRERRRI